MNVVPTATQAPLPPAVSEALPLPGSVISPAEGFTITFSEPMDRDSVEAALEFQTPFTGSTRWDSDTVLHVYPDPALPPESRFSIVIGESASAANGLRLPGSLEFNYKIPGELKLIDRFPGSNAVEVNPAAPLAVTFNQPVVPLSGDAAGQQSAFTLSPSAPGVRRMAEYQHVCFLSGASFSGWYGLYPYAGPRSGKPGRDAAVFERGAGRLAVHHSAA